MGFDPGFTNTASCRSSVTFIDGDKGILKYRGYTIEELAEKSSFLEVAYLLLYGDLPTQSQMDDWTYEITHHSFVHENIKKFMDGFRYDAHPMGILLSTVGALSTFYPDAKQIFDEDGRATQVARLIAKVPTIAAYAYRHSIGQPYVYPESELGLVGNFLSMLLRRVESPYKPNPIIGTVPTIVRLSGKFEAVSVYAK